MSASTPAQHKAILASHPEEVKRIALGFWRLKAECVGLIDIVEIVEAALAEYLSAEGADIGDGVTILMGGEIATDVLEVVLAP